MANTCILTVSGVFTIMSVHRYIKMEKCICCNKKILSDAYTPGTRALEILKSSSILRDLKIHTKKKFRESKVHRSCYKRFTDLRLNWPPEEQMTASGAKQNKETLAVQEQESGPSQEEEPVVAQTLERSGPAQEEEQVVAQGREQSGPAQEGETHAAEGELQALQDDSQYFIQQQFVKGGETEPAVHDDSTMLEEVTFTPTTFIYSYEYFNVKTKFR